MGLLSKLFGWKVLCPECGSSDAKDSFAGVCCRNPQCRNYDLQYAQSTASSAVQYTQRNPRTGGQRALPEDIQFKNPLKIEYVNFRNERKEFYCDRSSVLQRRKRISVRVEPTGRRIALAPERIKNLSEVHAILEKQKPDFTNSVEILYENYRGEHKTFRGDPNTIRIGGHHISVCVAPRGIRISLKRDKILNWSSVERNL